MTEIMITTIKKLQGKLEGNTQYSVTALEKAEERRGEERRGEERRGGVKKRGRRRKKEICR